MYCTNCGKEVDAKAAVCTSCGFRPRQERKFCYNCGESVQANQAVCIHCGVALGAAAGGKSKTVAGLLAIFLGGLGIHKFYLGYNKEGLILLLVTVFGSIITVGVVGFIIATLTLIEGIIYLTKSDDEFQATYVDGRKAWF